MTCASTDTSDRTPFARRLTTTLSWEDLVLHADTRAQLAVVETWLRHGDALLNDWGLQGKLAPGYRALFSGPSGTGKTLAASLLGESAGRDVYRVNLSAVFSRYIGETEKNLSALFAAAQDKNWILFFDEADALFGKRTDVRDAHDRYANQEVSYLLQRLEQYEGLSILASNLHADIDEAFSRRCQSQVFFPQPDAERRLQLWRRAFPDAVNLAADIDLNELAESVELNRAAIMNVVQYCCLQALERGDKTILLADIRHAVRSELRKSRPAKA